MQRLSQRFNSTLQDGPGWVHVVTETITDLQPGQVFPPPYLRSEQWYEVDTEGFVMRLVWTDFDKSGTVIQQSATVGNYSINFTTGDSEFNNGEHQRISLDTLTRDLTKAAQSDNSHLTREETSCENGRPCRLITGWQIFASPVQNPGVSEAFSGAGRRVWIDMQTGQQAMSQTFYLLPGSDKEITSTSRTILVEKAQTPPQDILDVLARVIVP